MIKGEDNWLIYLPTKQEINLLFCGDVAGHVGSVLTLILAADLND